MRDIRRDILTCLILIAVQALHAQSPGSIPASAPSPFSTPDSHSIELEQRLEAISSDLAMTHQQLEQSQQEMEQLRQELAQIKKLLATTQPAAVQSSDPGSP